MDEVRARQGHDPESIAWGFAEHLKYSLGVDRFTVKQHDRYTALAMTIRDRLIERWIETQQTHHNKGVKRAYYLSLEFLMGRAMGNNVINLKLEDEVSKAMAELGHSWEELRDLEVDAGLGNGGLGRLAACFLDSMATLEYPAFGYGLRYDYGIFRQEIDNGYQVEQPDEWLRRGNPWEIQRPDLAVPVHFGGRVEKGHDGRSYWVDTNNVIGIPYDMPIVGYGGHTVNTLRLWSAKATEEFDFDDFNAGDYISSVGNKTTAENLTKVLYPNDLFYLGRELRLKQQYFFVACSISDIMRRFRKCGKAWSEFPEMAAIQLNDTHPSMAIPELMRLLIDGEQFSWDEAWDITVRCCGYTNHTLMPEALEKWPVQMFEKLLPRHLEIIYEINHRFMQDVANHYPGDMARMARMSLVEESDEKQIRMANMSIVGSHSTNGVAALHTELVKSRLVPDFAQMFPDRFNNKTNGITPRRWLLKSNPPLAKLICDNIGEDWITDLSQLKKLIPLAEDKEFRAKFMDVKRQAKVVLADHMKAAYGWEVSVDSIFDTQIKRLHEYKRQLLNAMHIVVLYNRIRKGQDIHPRTFLFGAKAAPGYAMAKLIIKLINNIGNVVNHDPAVQDKLRVYFLPNYRVSLAEKMIPATDISEQISTAGTEASGTGNMKFMLNGALTVGTMDGANIEIVEEAGEENAFIFGLNADEVTELKPRYLPQQAYESNAEIKEAIDLIFSGHFNVSEPGIFEPIREVLFDKGDHYMHFADLASYIQAQERADALYRDPEEWARKAILNVANSGKFSSDRTIAQYASEIWGVESCHIVHDTGIEDLLEEARLQACDMSKSAD
jgi:starch phosphorylase